MTSIIAKLREIGKTDRTVAEEVRRSLVETLFTSSTSLGVGAVAGSTVSTLIAVSSGDVWLTAMAVAIGLVGAARVSHHVFFHSATRQRPTQSARSETIYELGAWGYSLLLGTMTLLTMLRSEDALHHMFAATLTTGYAAGICGRNAGRPVI
ncbi:MAG: GGDEF-domain containing protein, partial [Allosphingosinicella sp.]